jgi:hypothetical protein
MNIPVINLTDKKADGPPTSAVWRWYRVAAIALSLLFLVVGAAACVINMVNPRALDFLSFWAAGRLALDGQAAQ